MSTEDIISSVFDRLRKKGIIVTDEYNDEPILRTGSNLSGYIPDKIRELLEMQTKPSFLKFSNARAFYVSAKFMEDFEDNYDKQAPFFRYYPTYRDMSPRQLRTYFTWRAEVRKKNIKETSLSYVYVYMYELINNIGISSAEEGFLALKYLMLDYSKFEPSITKYYVKWLTDYAVYYGLPPSYLVNIYNSSAENAAAVLEDCAGHSDDELYNAITALSSYDPLSSAFVKKYPDDFIKVICEVFRKWSDYCLHHRKKSLCERFFGYKTDCMYTFFDDAVFFTHDKHPDCRYEVNSSFVFTCNDGRWKCKKYLGEIKKSKELGNLVRETDRIMRDKYTFSRPLTQRVDNKTVIGIIETAVDCLIAENNKKKLKEVTIDISSLNSIRSDAEITRDKLMTDEDRDEQETAAPAASPQLSDENNSEILGGTERMFLRILLDGGDVKNFALQNKIMLSVISEGINEKLFDMFGDTVIEFEDDIPHIVEDYKEELSDI